MYTVLKCFVLRPDTSEVNTTYLSLVTSVSFAMYIHNSFLVYNVRIEHASYQVQLDKPRQIIMIDVPLFLIQIPYMEMYELIKIIKLDKSINTSPDSICVFTISRSDLKFE